MSYPQTLVRFYAALCNEMHVSSLVAQGPQEVLPRVRIMSPEGDWMIVVPWREEPIWQHLADPLRAFMASKLAHGFILSWEIKNVADGRNALISFGIDRTVHKTKGGGLQCIIQRGQPLPSPSGSGPHLIPVDHDPFDEEAQPMAVPPADRAPASSKTAQGILGTTLFSPTTQFDPEALLAYYADTIGLTLPDRSETLDEATSDILEQFFGKDGFFPAQKLACNYVPADSTAEPLPAKMGLA